MPKRKRERRERTGDWQQVKQYTLWPEQEAYEMVRPIVLYGQTAGERSRETRGNERTLDRKADRFVAYGMASLIPLASFRASDEDRRELPPPIRQAIVDLKAEFPAFRPHEIASICFAHFGRQPSHRTIQQILAKGPPPSITGRRYPPYSQIPDQVERHLAMIHLHLEGWNTRSLAAYLQTTRRLVYETLQYWIDEGVKGLEPKSHAPKHPARKVTFSTVLTLGSTLIPALSPPGSPVSVASSVLGRRRHSKPPKREASGWKIRERRSDKKSNPAP